MRLFHKRTQPGRHRQFAGQLPTAPSRLSYHSRRFDQETRTGRSLQREERQRALKALGHFWLQRFGLAILLICAVVCMVNILSLSTHANVRLVPSSPATITLHSQSTYQAAASQLLAGSILNRTKITVDTSQLSTELTKQFPEIASVSVSVPLLAHRPIVYLELAEPSLRLVSGSTSAILDNNGRVLSVIQATTSQSADLKSLPVVTDQSGLTPKFGQQVLPSGDVSFIQTIVAQLAARKFIISSLTLPAGTSELDARIAGQPYLVKFNLASGDGRQQAGTFLAVQANLQSQHITPTQYIDVRVDGRAYYQ